MNEEFKKLHEKFKGIKGIDFRQSICDTLNKHGYTAKYDSDVITVICNAGVFVLCIPDATCVKITMPTKFINFYMVGYKVIISFSLDGKCNTVTDVLPYFPKK